MKNWNTLSIGISAYNEESNIKKLLDSIVAQSTNKYSLEEVIVVCDGCTDRTPDIVRSYAKEYPFVKFIGDGKRKGKAARLNWLYKNNTSDIILILDADVVLGHENVITEIVKNFDTEEVGLVGGFNIPLPPRNYFEKIMVAWLEIWHEIRINTKRGISIHNHLGCISALSKELAQQVTIPNNEIPDDDFVYMTARKLGYKFKFAMNAVAYYRTVDNFKDFTVQHSRLLHSKELVVKHFGKSTKNEYKTNEARKLRAIAKVFIRKPVLTILALVLQVMLRKGIFVEKEKYSGGFWRVASSSKVLV